MPYITPKQRVKIDHYINNMPSPLSDGAYNYAISRLIHHFITDNGLCYETLNAAVGILECAKQELLRTVVGPYEDKKRKQNGSVSELDAQNS